MASIRTRSRRLRLHLVGAAVAQLVALTAMAVNYTWSTGTFPGDSGLASPLGAADTLAIVPGGNKFINSPLLANGAITAADILYLQNGNTLTSDLQYNLAADVGLADGGGNGQFLNQGTLRKSGGGGASANSSLRFVNGPADVIDVQAGSPCGLTTATRCSMPARSSPARARWWSIRPLALWVTAAPTAT